MKDLDVTRREILETDKALAELFKKRMYLAKDVVAYKQANNLPILDEKREVLVRERFVEAVDDASLSTWAEKLITNVWGYDFFGDDRTLDTHIKLLRRHLGDYSSLIVTLRGTGYRFEG